MTGRESIYKLGKEMGIAEQEDDLELSAEPYATARFQPTGSRLHLTGALSKDSFAFDEHLSDFANFWLYPGELYKQRRIWVRLSSISN